VEASPDSVCATIAALTPDPPDGTQVKQRVLTAIGRLAEDPRSADLRRLRGRAECRLRVVDWRVIIELDVAAQAIIVQRILPRGRAYDR
jgi:mRNA-degrading endonuclease RelE of RelBE toxin-antitoxin system